MVEDQIRSKFAAVRDELDERARRLWAASEALALGHGGVAAVARATGMTPERISRGIAELGQPAPESSAGGRRVRRAGAGRKSVSEKSPGIVAALDKLVEPTARGDPQSPLRWTCKSLRNLSEALHDQGYQASPPTVSKLLRMAGYSLQGNRKAREGSAHPDRNAQFEFINDRSQEFMLDGEPAISVDCKKKELVGNYANTGREYRPKQTPELVNVHDFPDPELGKVAPYGVYDLADNVGWVNVGISKETSAFAVESIRRWWYDLGSESYFGATKLLITADAGGSNGVRRRQWKSELQKFADETGLEIHVSHLPPGTSKWNKIEHRLFCHITRNWRGRPLTNHEVVVNLISNTTTSTGLIVHADLDLTEYPGGVKISDAEMAALNLERCDFHGDWNYVIRPRPNTLVIS